MKKKSRMIIDISMTVFLPALMAYSLIGEALHEAIGTVMLVLFIAHHALNRGFFKALSQGRYTAGRAFQTAVDILLAFVGILITRGLMRRRKQRKT